MQSPVVWQSWPRSLSVLAPPWFPYLLPLSGGWTNSSGDESESVLAFGSSSWHCFPSLLPTGLWPLAPWPCTCMLYYG